MKRMLVLGLFVVLSAPVLAQDVAGETPPAATRPAQWAEPIALEGVPNLHRITPTLYRSEQPTALGMKNLEKLGLFESSPDGSVKPTVTVVDSEISSEYKDILVTVQEANTLRNRLYHTISSQKPLCDWSASWCPLLPCRRK